MPQASFLMSNTSVPPSKTAQEITELLRVKGARSIKTDYDDQGRLTSLSWVSTTLTGAFPFRLPVNPEAVYKVMESYYYQGKSRKRPNRDQAERTAWRVIKTWVSAQLALIETEMVTLEEVFMPYLLVGPGETMFQRLQAGGLPELTSGAEGVS